MVKKIGKGKEYDYDSKLIFEGIYVNGQRCNGIGYLKWIIKFMN